MNQDTMWDKVMELAECAPHPAPGQEVFLFGGGLQAVLTIPMLRTELNLTAVCDNDKEKQGTEIEGLSCVSPQVMDQYENPFVLISSCKHLQSICQELLAKGIPHCSLDAYVIHQNRAAFQEVYRSLDEESRRIYAGVLYCRLLGDTFGIEQYCTGNQYFCLPRFQYGDWKGIYIDCGACTGDVLQKMVENSIGLFRKIYAFEPNKRAYAALQKRVGFLNGIWALESGQIICEEKGVGRERSFVEVNENPANLGNTFIAPTQSGDGGIEIVSLDDYLAQRQEGRITFIKSDIEGSEWDMLHGAEQTIRRDKPNLAISIYHSIFDFFRIYQYLKQLVPEYTFVVRHHWNSFDETVLYCYIK